MPRRKPKRRSSDAERLAEASRTAAADRRWQQYLKERHARERAYKRQAGADKLLTIVNAPPEKARTKTIKRKVFVTQRSKKHGQTTDSTSYYTPITRPVRRLDDPCRRRQQRRAVLLAKGRVNKPGGAPGPYKRTATSKDPCK